MGAATGAGAAQHDAVQRGEYLFRAAGGCGCHTDRTKGGQFLAGGRALDTPFGVFFSPNITPDPKTGIGGWSDADFIRAMRHGLSPEGEHYFPVFPYASFSGMSDADLRDMKAYLDSVPAVRRANEPHDVTPPFGWRALLGPWKWLFFEPGPLKPDPARSARWNRGAYLATALAHCSECHTPRNPLGGPDRDRLHAGTVDGPEGERAPNITPHARTGIGRWSVADLATLLGSGLKPDFDNVQGLMAEAIDHGYKYLDDGDLEAMAEYVLGLPPIDNLVPEKAGGGSPSGFE